MIALAGYVAFGDLKGNYQKLPITLWTSTQVQAQLLPPLPGNGERRVREPVVLIR